MDKEQNMGISIDIEKAREIHKGELRIERKEKLEALDILFLSLIHI